MAPASARAVRFDRYGGLDVLYVADVPTPEPGPGEVLVEIRAAAINPGEAAIRARRNGRDVPGYLPIRGRQRPGRRGGGGRGRRDRVPARR